MKALTFDMTLEQPVLVSHPGAGEENSLRTLNYIPGSALRGAFISLYLKNKPGIDISSSLEARKWFFTGDNVYLHGYPTYQANGTRMLPRPLSWRAEKNEMDRDTYRIYDFAFSHSHNLKNPGVPPGEFLLFNISQFNLEDVVIHTPHHTLIPHNASIQRQIKRSQDSFVYHYDVLSEGQIFSSAIIGDDAGRIMDFLNLHDESYLFVGASRSANYGKIKLGNVHLVDDWDEYISPKIEASAGKTIITLLSDTICLNRYGEVQPLPELLFGVEPEEAFFKTCLVGGFNRKWGLPLSQAVAFQAGSVFVYSTSKLDHIILDHAKTKGIGERCAEGYGRIAINWNLIPEPRKINSEFVYNTQEVYTYNKLSERAKKLASTVALRLLRSDLDRQLSANLRLYTISKPPKPSQLSQVLEAARNSLPLKNLTLLEERLKQIKSVARNQFLNAGVEGTITPTNLFDWLEQGVSQDFSTNFWRLFTLNPEKYLQGFELSEMELNIIRNEYICRYIIGFMRLATKKAKNQDSERGNK